MATVNKKNTTKAATKNDKYSIENMRAVDNCGKTLAFFTLDVEGVKIYNLTLVDGKKGVFVGFPSKQGKDGKYYSTVWISDEKERETVAELAATEYNIITEN